MELFDDFNIISWEFVLQYSTLQTDAKACFVEQLLVSKEYVWWVTYVLSCHLIFCTTVQNVKKN